MQMRMIVIVKSRQEHILKFAENEVELAVLMNGVVSVYDEQVRQSSGGTQRSRRCASQEAWG